MPQQKECNDGLHKTKKPPNTNTVRDIESTARRPYSTKTESTTPTLSVISSPTSRRQRQNGRRCCTINDILYTIFFVLVFLWIILQHLLAQSFKNTTLNSSESTLKGVGEYQQRPQQSMVSWSGQIWSGIDSLFFTPPSKANLTSSSSQRMEEDYCFIFMLLLGINIATMLPSLFKHLGANMWKQQKKKKTSQLGSMETNEDKQATRHKQLLQTYLPAYLLATSADWLQGPYKYALYSSYGYAKRDIAQLFVAGYGSGMILGSLLGGLADSYGRKKLCLCYCLAYTLSVLTKHCKLFYVLMLGRACGGIATSLLYSCFESWLICAHSERGLGYRHGLKKEEEEMWLAKSLSISMYGSSLTAIGSGIFANFVVERTGKMRPIFGAVDDGTSTLYIGGYISAFDLCLFPLVLCATIISFLWEENYGEEVRAEVKEDDLSSKGLPEKHSSDVLVDNGKHRIQTGSGQRKEGICSALSNGINTVWKSPNILICCIVGSVFEGAIYVFIFLWTPSLTSLQERIDGTQDVVKNAIMAVTDPQTDSELPFGWIFATFMVSCMLGTTAFSHLSNLGISASTCLAGILALSSISCLAMARPLSANGYGSTSSATTLQYTGMLLYEFCIGFYYPAMGIVKASVVPEDQRAAIYNVYRLPLNLFMLAYLFGDFSTETSFTANAIFLFIICILQTRSISTMAMQKRSGSMVEL